jgi:DNA-directed RNA polymerase specialized sigma24 family protein
MSGGSDPLEEWFERDLPAMVGLARRVLDREQASAASREVAEHVAVEAFAARRRRRRPIEPEALTTAAVRSTLDGCLDRLVGHPGIVSVHADALGEQVDFDGELPLSELHDALEGMRRGDRRVGLLVLAAGYRPEQAACLLDTSLEDVLERAGRIGTRLADARRVGRLDVMATP